MDDYGFTFLLSFEKKEQLYGARKNNVMDGDKIPNSQTVEWCFFPTRQQRSSTAITLSRTAPTFNVPWKEDL